MTTRPQSKSASVELKALHYDDENRLRALLQEILEQEMTQALAAAPGERTPDRARQPVRPSKPRIASTQSCGACS